MPNPLFSNRAQPNFLSPRGWGGGYVPPQRVGFLRRFGLKTGIDLPGFGMESDMVFEGTTGVMNAFIVLIPNE